MKRFLIGALIAAAFLLVARLDRPEDYKLYEVDCHSMSECCALHADRAPEACAEYQAYVTESRGLQN